MLSDEQIGRWLRDWRRARDLSQAEVAAHLGRTQPSLSLIEAGRRKLTAAEFLSLQAWSPEPTTESGLDDHVAILAGRS